VWMEQEITQEILVQETSLDEALMWLETGPIGGDAEDSKLACWSKDKRWSYFSWIKLKLEPVATT